MNLSAWNGRRVFLTGHTGFKGGWLALWLHHLGAQVFGYSLDPVTQPSLFELTCLGNKLVTDWRHDINDVEALSQALQQSQPEVVFHLAAQALVSESYHSPIKTFATNVMGTANLLEALRYQNSVRAVLVITTDKVYGNREWIFPYREIDSLGGTDPYSASKAATELVAASFRSSFLNKRGIHLATARAGNVIGGGDWSPDRLVPDCLRAFQASQPLYLRHPQAVRPWQHVLEPLSGYLTLVERLLSPEATAYESAWNFGPEPRDNACVSDVATRLATIWGQGAVVEFSQQEPQFHETGLLKLDISRARSELRWIPRWTLQQALQATVEWQQAFLRGEDMARLCQRQIDQYLQGELP